MRVAEGGWTFDAEVFSRDDIKVTSQKRCGGRHIFCNVGSNGTSSSPGHGLNGLESEESMDYSANDGNFTPQARLS